MNRMFGKVIIDDDSIVNSGNTWTFHQPCSHSSASHADRETPGFPIARKTASSGGSRYAKKFSSNDAHLSAQISTPLYLRVSAYPHSSGQQIC
jgi:hypothetical protein